MYFQPIMPSPVEAPEQNPHVPKLAPGFFAKERIIAPAEFNRWLVPPAALAIHLCIGMAYGFSVFWLPLSQAIGVNEAVAAPASASWIERIFSTQWDWKVSMLGWVYTLFFVLLGSSTAIWGRWIERDGPRKAGLVSACCWCGGLVIAALGVYLHQILLLWLGAGVIGGIGLGLGYISPVTTLIRWFPDRRGMATGMAIMGFGGGAMIGAPLADKLMKFYATPTSVGVWETLLTLAAIYFIFMVSGALSYRLPPLGWKPEGWNGANQSNAMITTRNVHVNTAWRTPQFWFIWGVLCLNVSAGIGVIGMASPMLQEVFAGKLIGINKTFTEVTMQEKGQIAAIAAGFTGLLSLFNIAGRFFWASLSDYIGRKATYYTFFALGLILYASAPWFGHRGNIALFVGTFCIILSMYGGGFATIPAYLADIFGARMVSAIHGRLLTAWATAGILGPVVMNYLREHQLKQGVPSATVYDKIMYILAAMLVLGFICNLLVRPVAERYFMTSGELEAERKRAHDVASVQAMLPLRQITKTHQTMLAAAWGAVGIPLLWGASITLQKAWVLFR
jgi:MFS family permease